MNLGKFLWGLVVLAFGIIFLLINFGYLEWNVLVDIWRLWPLILIIAGLSIMSRTLPNAVNIFLGVFLILLVGLVIYNLVANPSPSARRLGSATPDNRGTSYTISEEAGGGATAAQIQLSTGAAKVEVAGGGGKLLEGTVVSSFLTPSVEHSRFNGNEKINVAANAAWIKSLRAGRNDWNLILGKDLPTSLELNCGAIDAALDLREVKLTKLTIKGGASSIDLNLGDKIEKLEATIELGASDLKINVPKGVGVKIKAESGLSSNNFASQDLTRSDDTFESADYEASAKKIEIDLKTGASSVELERS